MESLVLFTDAPAVLTHKVQDPCGSPSQALAPPPRTQCPPKTCGRQVAHQGHTSWEVPPRSFTSAPDRAGRRPRSRRGSPQIPEARRLRLTHDESPAPTAVGPPPVRAPPESARGGAGDASPRVYRPPRAAGTWPPSAGPRPPPPRPQCPLPPPSPSPVARWPCPATSRRCPALAAWARKAAAAPSRFK